MGFVVRSVKSKMNEDASCMNNVGKFFLDIEVGAVVI